MQGVPNSRILLVDDHETSLQTLRHILAREGYDLVEASTGREAVIAAREFSPDLVLLDVMLPDISGFEVCQEIRGDLDLAELPVVLITGLRDREATLRGLAAGADDFITKPVEPDELRARVRTITRLNRFRRMRDERNKYEQLVELSPDGIAVLDDEGCITLVNRVLLSMLGVERASELLRVPLAFCLKPLGQGDEGRTVTNTQELEPAAWILELLENPPERTARLEIGLVCASGEVLPVEAQGRTLLIDGRPGAQILFRDIRERREAEAAIRRANQVLEQRVQARTAEVRRMNVELEAALLAKDRFLSSMSHELRDPLNSLIGLTDAMLHGNYGHFQPEQIEPLQLLRENGGHLGALINNVLDIARAQGDAVPLKLAQEPCDPVELALASMRIIKPQANLKRQEMGFGVLSAQKSVGPPKVPWLLSADPLRLRQILVNLLSNAIKFTPERGALGLTMEMDTAREKLRYTVWDQGPGIAVKDRERIFQPFEQAGPDGEMLQGAGLGLSLVKSFTELHGGRVWLESKLGVGSRFTVELPWPRVKAPPRPNRKGTGSGPETLLAPETGQGTTSRVIQMPRDQRKLILLAEDRPDNVYIIREYLEAHDFRVALAGNGQEAVELTRKLRPQLVLMDVEMPDMDGLEATREIRQSAEAEIARTPIIALSSQDLGANPPEPEHAPDSVVAKPVLLRELLVVIKDLLATSER